MINEDLIQLISTVGFPIVMCLWFMFRTETVIKANTEALIAMTSHLKGEK
jgi:hypothetical protein